MSDRVVVDGVDLLPLKEVLNLVSYSRDYITKLAREKKIIATQIGRRWYVDPTSLAHYAEQSELEQQVRREQLRRERKAELEMVERVSGMEALRTSRTVTAPARALAFSLTVVMGAILGGTFLAEQYLSSPTQRYAQLAESSGARGASVAVADAQELAVTDSPFSHTVKIEPLASDDALGVLVLGAAGQERPAENITALFSDPVTVARDASGRTELRFEGESAGVPVVVVPLVGSSSASSTGVDPGGG
jgi:hypothetical protein